MLIVLNYSIHSIALFPFDYSCITIYVVHLLVSPKNLTSTVFYYSFHISSSFIKSETFLNSVKNTSSQEDAISNNQIILIVLCFLGSKLLKISPLMGFWCHSINSDINTIDLFFWRFLSSSFIASSIIWFFCFGRSIQLYCL